MTGCNQLRNFTDQPLKKYRPNLLSPRLGGSYAGKFYFRIFLYFFDWRFDNSVKRSDGLHQLPKISITGIRFKFLCAIKPPSQRLPDQQKICFCIKNRAVDFDSMRKTFPILRSRFIAMSKNWALYQLQESQ